MDNKQSFLLAQAKARAAGETQTQGAPAVDPVQKPVTQVVPTQTTGVPGAGTSVPGAPVNPPQVPVTQAPAQVPAPPVQQSTQEPVASVSAPASEPTQTPDPVTPPVQPTPKPITTRPAAPAPAQTRGVKPQVAPATTGAQASSSREQMQTLAQMVQDAHTLRQKTRAMVSDAVVQVLEKRVSEAVGQSISYDRSKPQSTLSTGRLLELVVLTLLGIPVPESDYAHETERAVHAYLVSLTGSDLAEQSSTLALRQVKSALSDLEDQMSRMAKMVQAVGQESKEHRVVTEYLAYQQMPQSAVPRSVDDYHLDTDATFEQTQRVLRRQAQTKVRQFQSYPEGARSRATPVRRAGSF